MVPGQSLHEILESMLDFKLEGIEVKLGVAEVGQMQRAYYPVACIDHDISPRRCQANVYDDVVGDSV